MCGLVHSPTTVCNCIGKSFVVEDLAMGVRELCSERGFNQLIAGLRRMSGSLYLKVFKGALLDVNGVLFESGFGKDGVAINGSVEAVNRLRREKVPFRFVTNETQCSRQRLVEKLTNLGFGDVSVEEIFCPAPCIVNAVTARSLRPYLLIHPDLEVEFDGVDVSQPNCVVVGDAAEHFTYEKVNEAFKILVADRASPLLAMGFGKYYKHGGELTLDLGAYVAALEYACDKKAEILGKPSAGFFRAALDSLNLKPEEVAMIGDDIVHDIGGSQAIGISGILVRTGKYRASDEQHPAIKPYAVVDDLSKGVALILGS